MKIPIPFIVAKKQLYKRVCPSVGPSVGPSVHPSVTLMDFGLLGGTNGRISGLVFFIALVKEKETLGSHLFSSESLINRSLVDPLIDQLID